MDCSRVQLLLAEYVTPALRAAAVGWQGVVCHMGTGPPSVAAPRPRCGEPSGRCRACRKSWPGAPARRCCRARTALDGRYDRRGRLFGLGGVRDEFDEVKRKTVAGPLLPRESTGTSSRAERGGMTRRRRVGLAICCGLEDSRWSYREYGT